VPNAPEAGSDFDVDADDIAELLDDGAHLVGHSYGGLVAMLAAARRPDAVRSLCLLEPAAPSLLADDAETQAGVAAHEERRKMTDPREFLLALTGVIGGPPSLPDPLPPDLERHVRLAMGERPAYEAEVPVEALAALAVPKLIISAGEHDRQEVMSDTLAAAIRADRAQCPGAGHLVPRAPGVNDVMERFWT
jgi:pimeloyl-ACP methyl ester carboxylesterase